MNRRTLSLTGLGTTAAASSSAAQAVRVPPPSNLEQALPSALPGPAPGTNLPRLWWFFQIQPEPMPEHLIGLDSVYYLREHLAVQSKTPGAVTPQAMAEYIRCYCCTDTIHAACEDYRAAATIDLDMDRADDALGRKIQAPVLALWGAKGTVGQIWDVLATWRSKAASQVTGRALPCGHLLPEEAAEEVLAEFRAFFEI